MYAGAYPTEIVMCTLGTGHTLLRPNEGVAPLIQAVEIAAQRQVIVYAPHSSVQKWIDEELVGEACEVEAMESLEIALDALLARDQRRKIFLVDFDWLDANELAAMEETWEGGTIRVALGHVPRALRESLHINYVVSRPLGSERLRAIISAVCDGGDTVETGPIERQSVSDV